MIQKGLLCPLMLLKPSRIYQICNINKCLKTGLRLLHYGLCLNEFTEYMYYIVFFLYKCTLYSSCTTAIKLDLQASCTIRRMFVDPSMRRSLSTGGSTQIR